MLSVLFYICIDTVNALQSDTNNEKHLSIGIINAIQIIIIFEKSISNNP